ncbi:hypothetical protein BJY16_002512 [Actinoplanes octamycinicus]|uniref:Coenzyme PQQ synthesis protein D (PqqD) n=1 Tax=Actinoplanes octamycinicus TaxID=135948 RepID=A0A7W7M6R0_9ACTN|nr:PqqD family protein [Actinoplanes octamycinicus]MBB4739053.1 hypothetical protein [Actinoplanes octamycinicus]GIE60184.1 hypothetical protein Aoc01nite_55860 [Actinoplanes octamycinicus]
MTSVLDVPRRTLGVPIRRVAGRLVVGVEADALEFSEVGSLIFTSANGRNRVVDIVHIVAAAYECETAEVYPDVVEFLGELTAGGIVEWSSAPAAAR